MQYEIDELLNEAVMTNTPSVIVEGIEDIAIYSEIARKVSFPVEIYAIESISEFGEGCSEVIRAIEYLDQLPSQKHKVSNHLLGIIDKDVREYRGEIPNSDAILVLKYYSIESHFVSQSIVKSTLSQCTKSSQDMITDDTCKEIMLEIEHKLKELYYHSLEALKNATTRNYDAAFSYSCGYGLLKDQIRSQKIAEKRADLDKFADSLKISMNFETIKCIARGKWLIEVFSEELLEILKNLPTRCQDKAIAQCRSCVNKAYNKCLYRVQEGFNKNTIKNLARRNVNTPDLTYIIERISNITPRMH